MSGPTLGAAAGYGYGGVNHAGGAAELPRLPAEPGAAAGGEARPILAAQAQENVKDQLLEVRLGFIYKVYGIVLSMLLVSSAIASPFVLYPDGAQEFLELNPWILYVCMVLLVSQQLMHACVMMGICVGNQSCLDAYIRLFTAAPLNYMYLFTYSAVLGVVIGIITLQYTASSVCLAFGLTAIILVALTAFAFFTQSDFSDYGPYVLVLLVGVLATSIVGLFFPLGSPAHRVLAGLFAVLFGFIIVYDTQMIFGVARSRNQKMEYSIDMYAFAAFDLYLDFVNFFIQMLELFGQRK
eukprot:TRINITY_DN26656_c0_g2_i1.p1 TRINITY_DN26656_c0_g2~~TRINITY_DN26656_c0_g2_i1.p1  ORF type:complete len:296 (+),score=70.77 TRINITY_DN26656_c0_g2_i1:170-1057(+)